MSERDEPQCTGPFSDAFDCPVHDPRKRKPGPTLPPPSGTGLSLSLERDPLAVGALLDVPKQPHEPDCLGVKAAALAYPTPAPTDPQE